MEMVQAVIEIEAYALVVATVWQAIRVFWALVTRMI